MPLLTLAGAQRTPALIQADRCTLFLVDRHRRELFSAQGAHEIRVPLTAGVVGHVATTGETVNIADACEWPRRPTGGARAA